MDNEINEKVLSFFEEIEKYYGSKTEITSGICTNIAEFNPDTTTWNLLEFDIIQSAYRKKGEKFMLEGKQTYYEIAADSIVGFKNTGRNKYEFIEQYSETVFRITKIRFHYNY
jgi:hypothetical protein